MAEPNREPTDDATDAGHLPVLVEQVLALLDPQPGQVVLDCTVGRGGHAQQILPRIGPEGRYIGLDLDAGNLDFCRPLLDVLPGQIDLVCRDFAEAPGVLAGLGVDAVDLLLADLGCSSNQIDDPMRGFSFTHEGPLDMRLDPGQSEAAADLVNRMDERDLADLIFRYGQERYSRKIARKIVEQRRQSPIQNTAQLAAICARSYGVAGKRQRIHPATRTFMALRIAVNDEIGRLERLLASLPRLVRPNGRAAIISFHSLEDRPVKHTFRDWAKQGMVELLTTKPVIASRAQRAANPRSRSAKLRAIRRLATPTSDSVPL
ncbi:MAG: 16S rRNA (cytosine(1402)-N(4))-methyltransferase [Planctomycetaceae bacterium]|nr:16S rRNA (cytosine(1402)-N(4))-methyltransferase [Planctomycetaceae bacterium]